MATMTEEREAQRTARRMRLDKALGDVVRTLRSMGAIRVMVFGSYVEGPLRRWSDLDILAVMPSTRSGAQWFRDVHAAIDTDVPVDIVTFTEQELSARRATSSFVRRALRTGRVVYEQGQEG